MKNKYTFIINKIPYFIIRYLTHLACAFICDKTGILLHFCPAEQY